MTARLKLPVLIRLLASLALAAVIFELGGIWNELHLIRSEQVKNALSLLPDERRAAIRETPYGRKLENTVKVTGAVEIEGDVKLDEPVQVEIDR